MSEALKRYKEIIAECNNLSHAQNTIYWDMETIMPKEGFKGHSDSLTYLSTEVFKKTTSDEFYKILKALNNLTVFVVIVTVEESQREVKMRRVKNSPRYSCLIRAYHERIVFIHLDGAEAVQECGCHLELAARHLDRH